MEPAVAHEASEQERLGAVCADDGDWRAGWERFEKTREPQRPMETYLTEMESSLTRLPSFRMVAGWFAVVGVAILAFIFTH